MKIRIYICFVILATLFSSCESWIEETNYVRFTQDKSYQTEAEVMADLYGIYTILNSGNVYGGGTIRSLADNASDCFRNANGVNEWSGYKFSATSNQVRNWWRGNYQLINASNALIKNIDSCEDIGFSDDSRIKVKAEARFFRALGYFNLVRAYGKVPIIVYNATDVSEISYPCRAELKELYSLMIADLEESVRYLDIMGGKQSGRVTRGSAVGMLAKVYLTKAYSVAAEDTDFENAVKNCEKLILGQVGNYSLLPVYADVFSPENEGNEELLFYVAFDLLPNTPSNIIKSYSPASYYPVVSGGAPYAPYTLVNSYDQSFDQRLKYGYMNKHPETGAWLMNDHRNFFCKYKDSNKTDTGEDRCDFPVLRYSDVLLMHSEAMHSGNISVSVNGFDKYYGINAVRARARDAAATDACKIPALNASNCSGDFMDIILQERAWELNCEGHRRWDLIRTGKLETIMTAYFAQEGNDQLAACEIRPEHYLYPMPQTEVDTNPNLVPPGETNNGYIMSGSGDFEDQ